MPPVIPQEPATGPEAVETHPISRPADPYPLLRLSCTNLRDVQTQRILTHFNPTELLDSAVATVLSLFYSSPSAALTGHRYPWPGTRSITLVLDSDMTGIAFTTSLSIDVDHKEIHLSTKYVASVSAPCLNAEIRGVMVHEMVHCWQWTAAGTPDGLIEGIADWVRGRAELAPPHWKRRVNREEGPWRGYEYSGYFLEWIEGGCEGRGVGGKGTVAKVNGLLRGATYDEGRVWGEALGVELMEVWKWYCDWVEEQSDSGTSEANTVGEEG